VGWSITGATRPGLLRARAALSDAWPDRRVPVHGRAAAQAAGIEVILDVVYNHTCEGNETGPTLSFRGLDNRSYYRLTPDRRGYINDTGTGNTLNVRSPDGPADDPRFAALLGRGRCMWTASASICAATLGRRPSGFDRGAALFEAIRQDPVADQRQADRRALGYRARAATSWALSSALHGMERQVPRRGAPFWRGDPGHVPIWPTGSPARRWEFDHSGRPATASVNIVTAHDGFTLSDVVSYAEKHNEANGEDNRDGHGGISRQYGWKGPRTTPRSGPPARCDGAT
jgi:isoamylase